MKKLLTRLCLICLMIAMIAAFAACNNDEGKEEITTDSATEEVTTADPEVTTADPTETDPPAGGNNDPTPSEKDYSYTDGITDDIGDDKF